MDPLSEKQLEELIHRELGKLPPRRAPATLIPRVTAAIQARARRPWWRRSWSHWPRQIQGPFVAVMLVLAGGLAYAGALGWDAIQLSSLLGGLGHYFNFLAPVWETAGARASACYTVGRAAAPRLLVWGLAAAGLMYLSCVCLGTVFWRVAFTSNLGKN